MIFNTWVFALFMTVVFITYWWGIVPSWRRGFLIGTGLVFFAYRYPPHTLLLLILTIWVYLLGQAIYKLKDREACQGIPTEQRQKILLWLGIATCIGALGYYKYRLPSTSDIIVPLGISYFTFEFIHYLSDLYAGKIGRSSFLDFSAFPIFFPTLASGPIKRFQGFRESEGEIKSFQGHYLSEGLTRILVGIAKKSIIADSMAPFSLRLSEPESFQGLALWLGVYAYALKIYFDFSGYSDMAIGCARLLGYRIPENFNYPYLQSNISEFWRRWHISLSSWIRDYLFIPLGGSRGSAMKTSCNLLLVMALCGIWHGGTLNYISWGVYHGLGLVVFRLFRTALGGKNWLGFAGRILGILLTFHFVALGWVFFATPSFEASLMVFKKVLFIK
jgi:alginate O-acetyltransferase complex protein AlgI